ncbi:MAG: hypothetical protein AAF211_05250 [Myxococcota bacterium]
MLLLLISQTYAAPKAAPIDGRWWIQSEYRFAVLHDATARDGALADPVPLRVRAVLDCSTQSEGRQRRVVDCTIDALSLQAVASGTPGQRTAASDATLARWDAALTGEPIRLVVRRGHIASVDLPTSPGGDRASRWREQARQLASRLVAPLELAVSEASEPGVTWSTRNPGLLAMPALRGLPGSLELTHRLEEVDGRWIVQSVGQSTSIPQGDRQLEQWRRLSTASADRTAVATSSVSDGRVRLRMTGAAQLDSATGALLERVWHVDGRVTPQEADAAPYTFGRLERLGPDEQPEVGVTGTLDADRWGLVASVP